MIYFQKGNLLTSDCTIIAHQANCVKTMGAGIAYSIQHLYPNAAKADKKDTRSPEERYGSFSCAAAERQGQRKLIFNLYGQLRPGKPANPQEQQERHERLKRAFERMLMAVKRAEEKGYPIKIGIPHRMGSDRAGGDWETILRFVEELSEAYHRDIYVYEYTPETNKPFG